MARKTVTTKEKHKAEDAQPPLIPMSEEEMKKASKKLAFKVRELEEVKIEHDAERKRMRETEKKFEGEISAIAGTIRSQGR